MIETSASSEDDVLVGPRHILLDTNILSRFEQTGIGSKVGAYLDLVAQEDNYWKLLISSMSIFEIMNEIPYEKENFVAKLIDQFPARNVTKDIFIMAARIGCMYKRHFNEIKCLDKMPEHGDKILAATALITDSIICTANMRDYPAPFFKEILREHITHDSHKTSVCLTIYFMEPQTEFILDYHEKRIPKHKYSATTSSE